MKEFTIDFSVTLTHSVSVSADTEEEAREKAYELWERVDYKDMTVSNQSENIWEEDEL